MSDDFDLRTDEERYDHVALTESGKSTVENDDRSTKDTLSTEEERETVTWRTDLGETMNWNKKLTLRDLGHYFGERFSASFSGKEGVNNNENDPRYFGGTILATPANSENVVIRWNSEDESALNNLYAEMVKRANGGSEYNNYKDEDIDKSAEILNSKMNGNQLQLSDFIDYAKTNGNGSGLRMGSSKVLNPDFQFNEVDDVRSDFRRPFIGRLYSERIYDYNLPIVYFQPGTVSIDSATVNFLSAKANAQFKNLQSYLKSEANPLKWVGMKLGNGITALLSTGSKILLDVGQWWKWTSQSLMYMRYVNEMLLELAEWMGMFQDVSSVAKNQEQKQVNKAKEFMESDRNSNSGWFAKFQSFFKGGMTTIDENGEEVKLTDDQIFEDGGPFVPGNDENMGATADVNEDGIQLHAGYIGRQPESSEKSSANVGVGRDPDDGLLSVIHILPMYADAFPDKAKSKPPRDRTPEEDEKQHKLGWKDLTLTVPYAISNTVSVSESFDNSTGQHPLVDRYNQQFEQANQARLVGSAANAQLAAAEAMDGNISTTGSDLLNFGKGFIKDAVSNATSSLGLSGEAGMVMTGAGRYVLPEIWNDSSFSRSYSVNFKFRSPYGSKLSIFENTFVPLVFLMAMAIPRKVAIQSYTNPFYVKSYCKGLFSIELGMITSLSISRGEEKNDRTNEQLFRSVNVTVNVKDMLACIPMGLDGGIFGISKSANNGMFNYMANLAGIDFVERVNLYHRANVAIQSTRNGYYDMLTKLKIGVSTKLKVFSKAGSLVGRTSNGMTGGGVAPHRSYQ